MKRHLTPARLRFAIQFCFGLFCLYLGFAFARFLTWVGDGSGPVIAKPGGVEGFLPISALLGMRQWLATGQWDSVHPAGLTIFLAVLTMAFLFRKGFCGYICPIGFLSSLLERLGRKLHLAVTLPRWADAPLMLIKYGLAGFFLFTVLSMNARAMQSFITGSYNMTADARMFAFFTDPTALSLLVLGVLAVLSIVIRNFWCRYLCPYGALLGLFSWLGPVAITRDRDVCIGCGKCTRVCPAGIRVESKDAVRSPECIGCAECIGSCPVDGCLGFSVYGRKRIPWMGVGLASVAVLLAFWLWAKLTGHWDSAMPAFMLQKIYAMFPAPA